MLLRTASNAAKIRKPITKEKRRSKAKVPPSCHAAGPQLASCASSGRAWRL